MVEAFKLLVLGMGFVYLLLGIMVLAIKALGCKAGLSLRPGTPIEGVFPYLKQADMVLVIGTSGLIYPAAGLPHYALELQKYVVEINPEDTPLSGTVSARIRGMAATSLIELIGGRVDSFADVVPVPTQFREHSQVELVHAMPELGLAKGAVGVIVHCHVGGTSFEVEFILPDGGTMGVATLCDDDLLPACAGD